MKVFLYWAANTAALIAAMIGGGMPQGDRLWLTVPAGMIIGWIGVKAGDRG